MSLSEELLLLLVLLLLTGRKETDRVRAVIFWVKWCEIDNGVSDNLSFLFGGGSRSTVGWGLGGP